LGSEDNDC